MTSRMELDGGAWLEYLPAWIHAPDADRLVAALRDELAWEHREIVMFGRRVLQPRLIAWAGSLGYRVGNGPVPCRPRPVLLTSSLPAEPGESVTLHSP